MNIGNPWFGSDGRCLVRDVPRLMCRRQIPTYVLEMFKKGSVSNLILKIYCARWFRALLLLSIVVILGVEELTLLGTENVWEDAFAFFIGALNIGIVLGILWAMKDIREFSLCVRHIICGTELSPRTFPASALDLEALVRHKLRELAIEEARLRNNAKKATKKGMINLLEFMANEKQARFMILFRAAEILGLIAEYEKTLYFRQAQDTLHLTATSKVWKPKTGLLA